jgi:hypothetical protein
VGAITEAKDDDEWRKRITSVLRRSPSVVLIDNVSRKVSSPSLAAVLTQTYWEDRILGQSETIRLPNRAAWVVTANNPTFSIEIARRSIRIRLDAKMQQPWLRSHFRRPNLREFVITHRGQVVWAHLVLCQAWIAAGTPKNTNPQLGSFESWSEVIGGLLKFIGANGFLENVQEFYEAAEEETGDWSAIVKLWWERYQDRLVRATDVYKLIQGRDCSPDLGTGNDNSRKTKFGLLLTSMRDRQFENYRLLAGPTKQGAKLWKLGRVG